MSVALMFLFMFLCVISLLASIWFNCLVRSQIDRRISSTMNSTTSSEIDDNDDINEDISTANDRHLNSRSNLPNNSINDRSVPPIHFIPTTNGKKVINIVEGVTIINAE